MKTGTITGTLYDTEAQPLVGTITFTPYVRTAILDTSNDSVVIPEPQKVTLVNGAFSVTLVATDDPDLNPNGWTYGVRIKSADGTTGFAIHVPGLVTTDLSTIIPIPDDTGTATVVGPQGPPGDPGISASVAPPSSPSLNQLWIPL